MNNKGADQPARLCRLISAFIISFFESCLNLLQVKFQFSSSVAEETGLSLTLSEALKTGFVPLRPICPLCFLALSHNIFEHGTFEHWKDS